MTTAVNLNGTILSYQSNEQLVLDRPLQLPDFKELNPFNISIQSQNNPLRYGDVALLSAFPTRTPSGELLGVQDWNYSASGDTFSGNLTSHYGLGVHSIVTIPESTVPGLPGFGVIAFSAQMMDGAKIVGSFAGNQISITLTGNLNDPFHSLSPPSFQVTIKATSPIPIQTPTPTPTPTPPLTPTVPVPTPPPAPHIQGVTVLTTQKTNKKGKPIGKPVLNGYQFTFNTAMNFTGNSANYKLGTYVQVTMKVGKKRVKVLQLQPIGFNLTYVSSNTVQLLLTPKQAFKYGGQITLVATGISSRAGGFLGGNAVYNIAKGGFGITHA